MKIKLTESQLINIVKEAESEKFKKFTNALDALVSLTSDPSNVTDFDKEMFSKLLGDKTVNPRFDAESADPADFEKIDILPLENTKVNSPFGPRNIGGGASRDHKGVDLYAKSGTPIYSVANGVVKAARDTTPNGCGGFVMIEHDVYSTKYCHLKKWVVNAGENVIKGQLIGFSGGGSNDPFRGNSMGAHLHYEVVKNGRHINPSFVHPELS